MCKVKHPTCSSTASVIEMGRALDGLLLGLDLGGAPVRLRRLFIKGRAATPSG